MDCVVIVTVVIILITMIIIMMTVMMITIVMITIVFFVSLYMWVSCLIRVAFSHKSFRMLQCLLLGSYVLG